MKNAGLRRVMAMTLAVLTAALLAGCANYLGRVKRFTPINQQCFLEFDSDVKIIAIDGKKVSLKVMTLVNDYQGDCYAYIPAGEHSLTIYYQAAERFFNRESSGRETRTDIVVTSDTVTITYDFIPGEEYYLTTNFEIKESDSMRNTNGVYFGLDTRLVTMGLVSTPVSYGAFDVGQQYGFVFDPGLLSLGLYAEYGCGMGIGEAIAGNMFFYGGGLLETFITSQIGLAFGGGYRKDFYSLLGRLFDPTVRRDEYGYMEQNIRDGPYVRAGVKFGRSHVLYGDFYFNQTWEEKPDDMNEEKLYPARDWGLGYKFVF